MSTVGLFLVLGVLAMTGATAKGTGIGLPKLSPPILQEDRLIFTSQDARRLLCVGLDGKVLWERNYDAAIRLFTGPHSEALLQTGRVVSSVSPKTGDLHARFTVEEEDDGVSFSSNLGSFVTRERDLQSEKPIFKLLDGETGKPLWRTDEEIEYVVCATPDLIVCLVVEWIRVGKGRQIGKTSLNGYDRRNYARLWSVPLADRMPWLPAAFKAPHVIYAEAMNSLVVLDCKTGRKLLTKQVEVPKKELISNLKIDGDRVVWLTHKRDHSDPKNTEHFLHFCTIPELSEEKTVVLKLFDIAQISFEGGFIISDALSRTACFRPEGEKVWERFQTARTPAIKDRIYFSDYDAAGTARLGLVEVPTGKETILYSERAGQ